jgi:DNA recombination protein RmuC
VIWLYVFLALAAGAAGAWFYLNARLGERLRARDADLARLTAALAASESSVSQLSSLNSQLQSALAAERAASTEKLAAAEHLKATLQTEFQALASRILDEKSARFTEHNKTQVEALLHPLRQQLVDFRQRVDTVYKTDSDDRAALKGQIEQLRLLNTTITAEAHALTTALKGQSQARGAWGELILERLLDSAGLVKGADYFTQESFTTDDGRRLRPDVILRLPDTRHLVIDSKVSLLAYERAVNAPDDATRAASVTEHARAVRTHVDQLSAKRYEDTGKLITPDYVLMFVPLESAFTLALETDSTLYEWAFDRRVILCTAPTLLVTLKTVATLWKQDRQTKNVQAIADRGGALYDKFAGLIDDLESLGLQLGRTRESYDAAMNKLKSGKGNLLAQVEDLKKLGARAKKSLPSSSSEES